VRDPGYPYELLAAFGFGYTANGFPLRFLAHVERDGGSRYIELGVEPTSGLEPLTSPHYE
jgi:hypothetical protein